MPSIESTSLLFSVVFAAALVIATIIRLWLALRQIRHVALHRPIVPREFEQAIELSAHQRAADYTIARQRLGLIDIGLGAAVLLGFTLLGGVHWLTQFWSTIWPQPGIWRGMAVILSVVIIAGVIDLPLSWVRQFVIEERFGFNRMTARMFIMDGLKSLLVGAALGLPLIAAMLWVMEQAPDTWWLWAWGLWISFNVLVLVLFPTVIAPLFNKFEPMKDGPIKERVQQLLDRCGFASKGLFVMDGSKRSSHGNAYFTGMGRAKRIVFFDTLLERLSPDEVEAVLAHELGHFKHRHIMQRIVLSFAMSFLGLALLGWLATQGWFYQGLGVTPQPGDWAAPALILFFLALPVFTFLLQPLTSLWSRRHEYQADAYASQTTHARHLISALVKLYKDNASTLTPDPLHSRFYDSHPPASLRVARLNQLLEPST
jgi:STE24 endopeptidase